jgi:hypothetical protein
VGHPTHYAARGSATLHGLDLELDVDALADQDAAASSTWFQRAER